MSHQRVDCKQFLPILAGLLGANIYHLLVFEVQSANWQFETEASIIKAFYHVLKVSSIMIWPWYDMMWSPTHLHTRSLVAGRHIENFLVCELCELSSLYLVSSIYSVITGMSHRHPWNFENRTESTEVIASRLTVKILGI